MSYNREKMVTLILNECESIEKRCDGYREKILDAIVEILNAEREHQIQRTQIQQQVNTVCHTAGDFLARHPDTDTPTEEATQ
jgi:predicted transcriptional regulator